MQRTPLPNTSIARRRSTPMAKLRKTQLARWAGGPRRISARVSIPAIAAVAVTALALAGGLTGARTGASGATAQRLNHQQFAQRILKTQAARLMTSPALSVLHMQATGSRALSPGAALGEVLPEEEQSRAATGAGAQLTPAFTNVRVNDPALDTHQTDQTTQSETT